MDKTYKHGKNHGNFKHGKPYGYLAWQSMHNRCESENNHAYKNYGGRGIKVCERWSGENGFVNFMSDMGPKPYRSYSIDRIDVNGDYCPENCRWASAKMQANNRRNNFVIKGKTLAEWGDNLGGSRYLVRKRIQRGWSEDDAISIPIGNPYMDRKKIHRANQHDITYDGKTQSMKAWARETGIPYTTISKRIKTYGWDDIRAITTPRRANKSHSNKE